MIVKAEKIYSLFIDTFIYVNLTNTFSNNTLAKINIFKSLVKQI